MRDTKGGAVPPPETAEREVRALFAERLRTATKGRKAADIAAAVGISEGTLSRYRSGERQPETLDIVVALARELHVSTDYLLGLVDDPRGREVPVPDPPEAWAKFVKLPVAAERVAAGFPTLVNPPEAESGKRPPLEYAFRASFFKGILPSYNPKLKAHRERFKLHVVQKGAMGESMVPTIRPGALLLIDCGDYAQGPASLEDIVEGAVHVISPVGIRGMAESDRGLTAKRLYISDGRIVLVSDNHDFPAVTFAPSDDLPLNKVVIGRVVWTGQLVEEPRRASARGRKLTPFEEASRKTADALRHELTSRGLPVEER